MKKEFSRVYRRGGWPGGKGQTVSGKTSTLEFTAPIRISIPELLRELNVRTVLDAPCGDFNWFGKMDLSDIRYIGMDIVDGLVTANQEKYGSANRKFLCGDATKDPLKRADILICRDLFKYLRLEYCLAVLRNFVRAEIPWILISTDPAKRQTDFAEEMGSRHVNLLLEPFCFPEPRRSLPDGAADGKVRFLCLWSREEVAAALKRWDINAESRARLRETLAGIAADTDALHQRRKKMDEQLKARLTSTLKNAVAWKAQLDAIRAKPFRYALSSTYRRFRGLLGL